MEYGGKQFPNRWKFDFDRSVSPPPRLAFAVFDMVRKEGKVMYPHRYDFKARAREEDLNRGVIGSPMRGLSFLATGHVVLPATHRGEKSS